MNAGDDDLRLRRDALQIALQLPEDTADALRVLDLTKRLITGFMAGRDVESPTPPERPPLRLV